MKPQSLPPYRISARCQLNWNPEKPGLPFWDEHSLNARRLYERLGFVRAGTKKFIVGTDVQQDVVYARPVKNAF